MKTTLIAMLVVLGGCRACEERSEVIIEAGEVEILDAGVSDADVEPMPVVVDASVEETIALPLVDEHPAAQKPRKGWRSRCDKDGFLRLDGGAVLTCNSGL